jgi:predicted DNA-binding transcriptional regulator AlpA
MSGTQVVNPPSYLLTAKAVGQTLSLSKRQVFRLNSCGKIPSPIRIGGSVRWSAQEISDWLVAGAPDRKTWQTMKGVNHAG